MITSIDIFYIYLEPFRKELSEIAAPSRTVNQAGESGHALDQMTYRFALDKDTDVRSFVMSFVDADTLEKQREKEMKAAVQVAEAAIEARNEEESSEEDDETESDETEEEEEEEEGEEKAMQDVEKSRSPVPEKESSEPMDTHISDEDEIMADVDDKPVQKSTTTAVVLPNNDKKE